jgi:YhcH/YjgK/YiaL family protein
MFIGTVSTLEKTHVEYPEAILQALHYLRDHDFSKMADGKYTIADGITANVQRYETKPVAECRPESHEKYVDIQYIVEGEEYMGWCPLSPDLQVSEAYDAAKDVGFFCAPGTGQRHRADAGRFCCDLSRGRAPSERSR